MDRPLLLDQFIQHEAPEILRCFMLCKRYFLSVFSCFSLRK